MFVARRGPSSINSHCIPTGCRFPSAVVLIITTVPDMYFVYIYMYARARCAGRAEDLQMNPRSCLHLSAGCARDEQVFRAELKVRRRGRLVLGSMAHHNRPLQRAGEVRQRRHAHPQHVLQRLGERLSMLLFRALLG